MVKAKDVVESPDVEVLARKGETATFSKRHGEKVFSMTGADFWSLTKRYGNEEITVIVRQIGSKEKHFFSIYDKKKSIKKTAI